MSIAGNLEDMSIVELLQLPVRERKSSIIKLNYNKDKAELYYKDGILINAQLNNIAGEEAVYELLDWSHGQFELISKSVNKSKNINKKIENLIMEGVHLLDEKHQRERHKLISKEQLTYFNTSSVKLLENNELITMVCIIDPHFTKTLVKHARGKIPENINQSLAIILEILRNSTSHIEDDPMESFMIQTRSSIILSHRLAGNLTLIVVCDKSISLGQLFLTVSRSAESMDKIIDSEKS